MNCEKCQELIHELLDGSISRSDELTLNTHLRECLDCESVRQDLTSIVGFCRASRGEYEAPPNSQALWLRIRNVIESDTIPAPSRARAPRRSFLADWMGRSWELSLPQLASLIAAIVLCVSLVTVVGVRRWGSTPVSITQTTLPPNGSPVTDRVFQR